MPRVRLPGTSKVKRSEETKQCIARWEAVHAAHKGRAARKPKKGRTCEGYQYLYTIWRLVAPENEILAQALGVIQALGLDGPDWRKRITQLERDGGGGNQDDFAFTLMSYFIEELGFKSQKRAAEYAVAFFGLYPEANSFHSAVTRCRGVWLRYKKGSFVPIGKLRNDAGITIRPRLDNLRPNEVRRIIDPIDLKEIPQAGKRVNDNVFWRGMIDLGLVEILQDD